jgi:hypothetical protein
MVVTMKEVLSSSETSVRTRATRHNIPEDTILNNALGLHVEFVRFQSLPTVSILTEVFYGIFHFLRADVKVILLIGHDCFLPNMSQFIFLNYLPFSNVY